MQTQDDPVVDISLKGTLSIGYGGSIHIRASVVSKNQDGMTFIWQKVDKGVAQNLNIDNLRYYGSSCDMSDLQLVIHDVDETDIGVYRLEVTSQSQTTYSEHLKLDIYGDPSASLSREDNNYLRFYLLCQQLGTEAVRLFFQRHVPETTLAPHLSKYYTDLTFGNYRPYMKCTADQHRILFPGTAGSIVKSSDFDFSLLYKLIRNTVNVPQPSQGWGSQPASTDIQETDDVERIHHTRNTLAHNTRFTLSNGDFQTYWPNISQAIDRLSKGSLYHEVKALLVKRFDRHERQKITEDINSNLKRMDDKIEYIEKSILDTTKHLAEVEFRHIPPNIRDTHVRQIQIWKEDDNVFNEETKLFESAWNIIDSETKIIFLFVGSPGCGKTATARHIALRLQENHGYEIVPVCESWEISLYANSKCKQVFVFDDVLGTFSVDMNKYNSMTSYEEKILNGIVTPSKILFTCRRTVYNDVNDLDTFVTDNCIDLESEENKLSYIEIIKMMKKHGIDDSISNELSDIIRRNNGKMIPMLPLLCRLYASNLRYREDGVEFFIKPVQYLLIQLKEMRKLNKQHYTTLILCLFNSNKISLHVLPPREIRNEVYNSCGLSLGTPRRDIADAIEQMNGTYLVDVGTHFTFIHDSIFEVVAYHYGKCSPQQIIKYMSSDFIARKIEVEKEEHHNDLCISIDETHFQDLAVRLYKDIESMELKNVFKNPSLHFTPFLETFLSFLKQKPYTEWSDLFMSQHDYPKTSRLEFDIKKLLLFTCKKEVNELVNCNIRVISWIILYGHSQLLSFIVKHARLHNETERVFGCDEFENSRLLQLACCSKSKDTVEITLQYIRKECITSNMNYTVINSIQKSTIYNPIHQSCVEGNLEILKLLFDHVKRDAIENIHDLYNLRHVRQYDVIKFLIEEGADINHDDDGYTLLYSSARDGQTKTVQYLLKNGASINNGKPPLHDACQGGYIDIVKMLVEAGSDINQIDYRLQTPLCFACEDGQFDVVKYLTEKGANINKVGSNDETPLYLASYHGYHRIVHYLIEKGAPVNVELSAFCGECEAIGNLDIYRRSNLDQINHLEVVKCLIEKGADIDKEDKDGCTALYWASFHGHSKIVKHLIEKGASVYVNPSLLCAACIKSNNEIFLEESPHLDHYHYFEVVKCLIEKGAVMDKEDKDGYTALYWASFHGHTKIVKYLLEKEASAHVGCSPLCGACLDNSQPFLNKRSDGSLYNQFEVVKCLIEKGADIHKEDKDGYTALYWASCHGHSRIVQHLIEKGASVYVEPSPLCGACKGTDNERFVEGRLNMRFDSLNHFEVVKCLIEKGADIDKEDKDGYTALYWASFRGHTRIVQYLIERGASVYVGYSPLCGACTQGSIEIVKILIETGSNINQTTADNKSPLSYALCYGHYDLFEFLVERGACITQLDMCDIGVIHEKIDDERDKVKYISKAKLYLSMIIYLKEKKLYRSDDNLDETISYLEVISNKVNHQNQGQVWWIFAIGYLILAVFVFQFMPL